MTHEMKGMILGSVAAIIASVLSLVEEYRLRNKRPRIIRQPYVNRDSLREANINSILHCGDTHCLGQIRMRPAPFYSLCNILVERGLLRESVRMSVKEQVIIFLHLLGHNVRFRVIGGRFFRSTWTVHYYFHIVLQAILRLYPEVVKPPTTSIQPEIQNNPRFFPWFEDFIGAIDGTHVRASVPIEIQDRFRGRKGRTTQNVLAAVDFDAKFTYVLACWEGSAHDLRVLNDALSRGFKIPEGKYYLADAGFGSRKGLMPPYRRTRYHLKEFTNNPPENERELFNLRHSSIRMVVERAFGILKARFRVLDAKPFWSFKTQVKNEEKKGNFRWSKQMSKELLAFLAEEVRKGNRPNNTFRTSSFVAAAKNISEKFKTSCTANDVENHMRMVKANWAIISKVRGNSGFGWNDTVKMVTTSPNAYNNYVQENPSHEKYLNRKIDMYEEIAIVAGKDMARGDFSKSFADIELNNESGQGQPTSMAEDGTSKSDSATSSEPRQHRKRTRGEDDTCDLQQISNQLGEVVSALKKFSNNQLDVEKLYEEIMKMDDFEEAVRDAVFDHLVELEMLAKTFLTKSKPLRRVWIRNFINSLNR
uniref:Transposase n=1 Tax=Chenopodium quinoa TaxID=63459 RepID=A0A803N8W4_CHEQI